MSEWLQRFQYISVPEWFYRIQYISVPEYLASLQYYRVLEPPLYNITAVCQNGSLQHSLPNLLLNNAQLSHARRSYTVRIANICCTLFSLSHSGTLQEILIEVHLSEEMLEWAFPRKRNAHDTASNTSSRVKQPDWCNSSTLATGPIVSSTKVWMEHKAWSASLASLRTSGQSILFSFRHLVMSVACIPNVFR